VAIARALAIEPKMLLLDEPLSALDKKLREEMQLELRQIQKTVGITTLFVTHDQEEALALADNVIVMTEGTVRQVGSPTEIYMRPVDAFVAGFIGQSNLFNAVVTEMRGNDVLARLASGEAVLLKSDQQMHPQSRIAFSVRPERLRIEKSGDAISRTNMLDGKIQHVIFMGSHSQVRVAVAGNQSIKVQTSDHCREGDNVTLSWSPQDAVILPNGTA
jgi:spermidine/putrescine transport system ATP-binding protein